MSLLHREVKCKGIFTKDVKEPAFNKFCGFMTLCFLWEMNDADIVLFMRFSRSLACELFAPTSCLVVCESRIRVGSLSPKSLMRLSVAVVHSLEVVLNQGNILRQTP